MLDGFSGSVGGSLVPWCGGAVLHGDPDFSGRSKKGLVVRTSVCPVQAVLGACGGGGGGWWPMGKFLVPVLVKAEDLLRIFSPNQYLNLTSPTSLGDHISKTDEGL